MAIQELKLVESRRYLHRGPYRSGDHATHRFELDLEEGGNDETSIPWLKAEEFLEKYRMSRSSFWDLVDLIKDDEVFK